MRRLTASQKIALLERRVANMERARNIRNLQKEVSRANKMSLEQISDLKDQIEELDYDPNYAVYERAIQSMIKRVENIRTFKLNHNINDPVAKKFLKEMMGAKSYPEFHKVKMEAHAQGLTGALRVGDHAEEVDEKESDLFARYLLGFYDPNFELDVRSRGGEKKGFVTFGDRKKHRIRYGEKIGDWYLYINEKIIFVGFPSVIYKHRIGYCGTIYDALKSR